ncbi:methyltransferase domain-containing protein [Coxiella-like endosymbiont]|uniref:methyltransferase domain-containing protein n=1 Tax=Coxiella-like endosymbiont TaxID=1592897 RepID=UPI0034E1E922
MLKETKVFYPDLKFIEGDIANFFPSEKTDYLFANVSFQWLNAHDVLISKLLELLNQGGVFGF